VLNPVRSHLLAIRHLHRGTIILQRGRCTPTCSDENNKSVDLHLRTWLIRVEMERNDKRRGVLQEGQYSVTGLEYCIFEKLEGTNKRCGIWRSRSMLNSIAKFLAEFVPCRNGRCR
jgi:hypothetical protein